jgi:hypothetical protein
MTHNSPAGAHAAILTATLIASATPATAIDCQSRKGDLGYWSWREIDGRRCWYLGHRGRDKRSLHWLAEATRTRLGAVRAPEAPSRPPRRETQPAATPSPTAAEAGAVLAPVVTRWPDADMFEAAAVTAAAPQRLVPRSGAPEPAATDRRHQPVTPPGHTPALALTLLLVALGMIAAGTVIIRSRNWP